MIWQTIKKEREYIMNKMNNNQQLQVITKQYKEKNKGRMAEMAEVVAKMSFNELIERKKTTTNPIIHVLLNDNPYRYLLYKASNMTNASEISKIRAKMVKIIIERMEQIIEKYIMSKIYIGINLT